MSSFLSFLSFHVDDRDIKPHNFALGVGRHNSTVYIVDFGLSSFYRSSSGLHVRYTDEHSIAGTKGYMSHNALLGIGNYLCRQHTDMQHC